MNRILIGDVLTGLAQIPDGCVQTCVTSPPYYGLRDYGVAGQIGLEESPEAFIARLVEVFRGVRRTLRKDGTVWLNMGDSYAGSRCGPSSNTLPGKRRNHDQAMTASRRRDNAEIPRSDLAHPGLKPKDMLGIPWMLAFALRADGWYLRQDIIWHKPNPMPESVKDRCTKAHEYLFLLSKSESYYFDAAAIGEAPGNKAPTKGGREYEDGAIEHRTAANLHHIGARDTRNKRSVWTIATQPMREAHFATFPEALVEPCIRAGSRPGDTVLDPFLGAGTTALVAEREGRQWIGCELNPDYVAIAERRLRWVQKPLLLKGVA